MTAAAVIVSVPLIAEFLFAPFNLWSGRTIDSFVRFTALAPSVGTRLLAPAKLVTAAALIAGIAVPGASIAGAALTISICAFYLVRLSHPGRRDVAGLTGFTLFAALGSTLLSLRLLT